MHQYAMGPRSGLLLILASLSISVVAATPSHVAAKVQADDCDCVRWADAYAHHGAVCGQVTGDDKVNAGDAVSAEACDQLFKRSDHSFCVNRQRNARAGVSGSSSWCYVSSRCKDLEQGAVVESAKDLSWKTCEKEAGDVSLQDLTPDEIIDLSAEHDLDSALLFDYAYLVEEHVPWDSDSEGMAAERAEGLRLISNSGVQRLLPSSEGKNGPRMLISGRTPGEGNGVRVNATVGGQKWVLTDNAEHKDLGHPGTFWKWSCLEGCV